MKKAAIISAMVILGAAIFFTVSCKNKSAENSAAANNSQQVPKQIQYDDIPEDLVLNGDGTFTSPLRPNEKLQLGKVYTDTFEYLDFDDNYDDFYIFVKKDTLHITLITSESSEKLENWARGDLYRIEWSLDTLRPAGDESLLRVNYFAEKMIKIKDGKVSLFREKYAKPLKYTYNEEDGHTDFTLRWIYRKVEYYLANSQQKTIIALLNDSTADILYSIEEETRDKKKFFKIGISNRFEGREVAVQWIFFDYNNDIFEYDLPNDKFVKFKE